ncbi:MAG: hypothetical protein PUB39_04860 [Eubacteriales bacterium]|nr:hypothetical protein [Eubacteriales bacterium]
MGKYDDIMAEHRPSHENDEFSRRHPKMDRAKRAKLFIPFDALRGFDEAVGAEKVITQHPAELSDEQNEDLDRKFSRLYEEYKELPAQRSEREGLPEASFLYFVRDPEQESLKNDGIRGNYMWISGKVSEIDVFTRELRVDDRWLSFEYIYDIRRG